MSSWIVRACQNRRRLEPDGAPADDLLFQFIDAQPEQGRFTATIPAAPGRAERRAELALRFAPVTLRRPLHGADPTLPGTLALTLVDVREISAPPDGKPIHWRLLTTCVVTQCGQARRVIDLYRQRWTIEEFFRTQKTAGFDIEAADIGEPQAMINFVAAVTIASVTIKQLVQARDGTTEQRLADAFEPQDQPILEAVCARLEGKTERQRNPHRTGSLAFAAWVIARLGGWTGLLRQARTQGHADRHRPVQRHQIWHYAQASKCVNPIASYGGGEDLCPLRSSFAGEEASCA